jgi:transposase-like protein
LLVLKIIYFVPIVNFIPRIFFFTSLSPKFICKKKDNKGGIRHMKDFTLKAEESLLGLEEKSLQELARIGAQKMLKLALEEEVKSFVNTYTSLVDSTWKRQIVRNGYHNQRNIQTGIGEIGVQVTRTRDRRIVDKEDQILFQSSIIPRYLRRTKELNEFIPFLYLKGISSGDFSEVLSRLLSHKVSFSASTVVELKKHWEDEYHEWSNPTLKRRNISTGGPMVFILMCGLKMINATVF